jgi:hypothetical protein
MTQQLTAALRRSILMVATSASVDPGDPPADQSHGVAVLTWQS